jgi:hypothetical protein
MTVVSLRSQTQANGRTRYFVVATTTAVGGSLVPTGTVVFRRNGHSIGTATLKNGTAVLMISRKAAQSGRFVARFQGSTRFLASNSPPTSAG